MSQKENKTKILISIYELNQMFILNKADGFLIGNNEFGTRLTNSYSINEINQAIEMAKSLKKEIFLVANQMMTDNKIKDFNGFLNKVNLKDLNGIIVGDIGAGLEALEIDRNINIIYNPETLLASSFDFNYVKEYGFMGGFIAKEITLGDILTITSNRKVKSFMVGHGHLNMFYSKRPLVSNFLEHSNLEKDLKYLQNLTITEEKRAGENMPILEDDAGTHVFRSKIFSSYKYLDKLIGEIDYLILDTLFFDDSYGFKLLELYKSNNDLFTDSEKELFDDGFMNKKTIYKR